MRPISKCIKGIFKAFFLLFRYEGILLCLRPKRRNHILDSTQAHKKEFCHMCLRSCKLPQMNDSFSSQYTHKYGGGAVVYTGIIWFRNLVLWIRNSDHVPMAFPLSRSLPLGWGLAEGEEVSHLFHLTSLTWLEQHCASLWGKGAGLLALAWARASALALLTWKPLPSFRSTTLNVLDVYTSKGNLKQNRRTLLFFWECSDCMYTVDFKLWISTEEHLQDRILLLQKTLQQIKLNVLQAFYKI